jgi:hypothetical protein
VRWGAEAGLRREEWSLIDALSIVSFMIGLANLDQNLDQSQLQEALGEAVSDIHHHLQAQDDKLDHILSIITQGGY